MVQKLTIKDFIAEGFTIMVVMLTKDSFKTKADVFCTGVASEPDNHPDVIPCSTPHVPLQTIKSEGSAPIPVHIAVFDHEPASNKGASR